MSSSEFVEARVFSDDRKNVQYLLNALVTVRSSQVWSHSLWRGSSRWNHVQVAPLQSPVWSQYDTTPLSEAQQEILHHMRGMTLEIGRQLWKEYSYVTHKDTVIEMEYIDAFQTGGVNQEADWRLQLMVGNQFPAFCMQTLLLALQKWFHGMPCPMEITLQHRLQTVVCLWY